MEINTSQILSIYKESLYVNKNYTNSLKISGEGNKKILVLYTAADAVQNSMDLLQKILGACKLIPSDYWLVEASADLETLSIAQELKAEKIISFGLGIYNELYKLPLKTYQILSLQEMQCIISQPLSQIATNNADKNALWQALQKMFL
jgi:DNA polymerase III psi subunit